MLITFLIIILTYLNCFWWPSSIEVHEFGDFSTFFWWLFMNNLVVCYRMFMLIIVIQYCNMVNRMLPPASSQNFSKWQNLTFSHFHLDKPLVFGVRTPEQRTWSSGVCQRVTESQCKWRRLKQSQRCMPFYSSVFGLQPPFPCMEEGKTPTFNGETWSHSSIETNNFSKQASKK